MNLLGSERERTRLNVSVETLTINYLHYSYPNLSQYLLGYWDPLPPKKKQQQQQQQHGKGYLRTESVLYGKSYLQSESIPSRDDNDLERRSQNGVPVSAMVPFKFSNEQPLTLTWEFLTGVQINYE